MYRFIVKDLLVQHVIFRLAQYSYYLVYFLNPNDLSFGLDLLIEQFSYTSFNIGYDLILPLRISQGSLYSLQIMLQFGIISFIYVKEYIGKIYIYCLIHDSYFFGWLLWLPLFAILPRCM